MFEEKHYVPILKWKQGEQKALEEVTLPIKNGMTPLLELPPIDWGYEHEQPKKTIDEHLVNVIESIKKSWIIEKPLFLDLLWIDPSEIMQNGNHPLAEILKEARSENVKIIPVTGTDRDVAYQSEVKNANKLDNLGICFRFTEADFENLQKNVDSLLNLLEVRPDEVDFLIDYGYRDPVHKVTTKLMLTSLINKIPYIQDWRNIILGGTSFPKDLSQVSGNSVGNIERTEWIIWKDIVSNKQVLRNPIFGDYAIANPEPFDTDPRFIRMSANIRYTAEDKFLIFKGIDLRKYGFGQYRTLAQQVVSHTEYYGRTYSKGDENIYDISNGNSGTGNSTTWRKIGTNHHLTVKVNELSSFGGI